MLNSNMISNKTIIGSNQSDNADECPDGLSCVSGAGHNSPYVFWSVIITISCNNPNYKQQLALPFANSDRSIAYRKYDAGNWYPWEYFTGSTQ